MSDKKPERGAKWFLVYGVIVGLVVPGLIWLAAQMGWALPEALTKILTVLGIQ